LEKDVAEGIPLLQPVMAGGKRVCDLPDLAEIRSRVERELKSLPAYLRGLEPSTRYPVQIAPALQALRDNAAAEFDR